ncbi:Uncharacterised protein [Vibrio cholerae]|nr:Uncharacterised protein [Vibrio cholerae]
MGFVLYLVYSCALNKGVSIGKHSIAELHHARPNTGR